MCILCACNAYASRDYICKEEFLSLPRIRYEYMYANTRITKDIFANVAFYEDYNELYQGTLKLEVSTLETLRQLVAEDIGVTVMPSIILNNDMYFRRRIGENTAVLRCESVLEILCIVSG